MSNSIDTKIIGKLAEILDKNQLTGLKYEDENKYVPHAMQPTISICMW